MAGTLVSTDWLYEHLDDPRVVILEVSKDRLPEASYATSHIPGARYAYWKDLCWHPSDRQFPTAEMLAGRVGRLGVGDETQLVLVGDPIQFATYPYWVLAMAGFEHLALLLDGGRRTWEDAGLPLTDVVPDVASVTPPTPLRSDTDSRIGRDAVRDRLGAHGTVIVDLRSPEEFRGDRVSPSFVAFDHGAERSGHIPGARHLYYERLLDAAGRFRPAQELAAEFAAVGADGSEEVVTYCRLSHRASLGWFVLTRLLGREQVRVYDGSWTEWGSIVGFPVER